MQSLNQCCAARVQLLSPLLLLSLLCGAVAGPWPDTWRPYPEPSDGGGATVAEGRTSDQQWQHQRHQQSADGTTAWEYTNIALVRPERDTVVPSDARQARATTAGQARCSCQNTATSYGKYNNGTTTLSIVMWAALAVVAWYTPVVGTFYQNRQLKSNTDWSEAYKQLRKGIARWSASLSEQASPSTSQTARQLNAASSSGYDEGHHVMDMFSGLTGRRRRSLSPWTGTRRRSPAARGGGITQRLQRMGRKAYQTASTVPRRLMGALQSWSLPSLWSSSGGASLGTGIDRSDRAQSGGSRSRQRAVLRFSRAHYNQGSSGGDGQHYPEHYSYGSGHHSGECHCAGQRQDRGNRLNQMAGQFLHNSYWIPAIGLALLVAEEATWWIFGGSFYAPNDDFVIGVAERSYDYLQSLLQSSEQQSKNK